MDDPTTPRYAMSGFHIETGGFLYAEAIDARHRTSQLRHDMAAVATLKQSLTEPNRIIRKVGA